MTTLHNQALEALKARIDELEDQARELVNQHWAWHLGVNDTLKPPKKARLNCWCRRRGDSLEITWTFFRFIPQPGEQKSKIISFHLSKGRGDTYATKTLAKEAQDWEVETALQYEASFGTIRREYRKLRQAMKTIKEASKQSAAEPQQSSTNQSQEEVSYDLPA